MIAGPSRLDCPQRCKIPEGIELKPIPAPAVVADDQLVCPHGCGRAFQCLSVTVTAFYPGLCRCTSDAAGVRLCDYCEEGER